MTEKLLYKTQKVYLIYSVLLMLIIAPLFYFITEKIYLDEADETLMQQKFEFLQHSLATLKENDIAVWNKFNKDVKIKKTDFLQKDSLFFSSYFDELEQENEFYRELNAPISIQGNAYTFVAKINLLEAEDLIFNIVFLFLILLVLLLVGLFIITKKLSVRIWQPFYETLAQIEAFEIDKDKKIIFNKTNIQEFSRLNQSVENLIEKNRIIYKNQREFVENAAHELQTPIAVFQAKVDTLIQRSDVTEEQFEILDSLNNSLFRLNRLNKNLLFLSKIDSHQNHKRSTFSITELVEKQLCFFSEQAKNKHLKIEKKLHKAVFLKANFALTESLISNLFLNAIRHNIQNGEIIIELSEHSFRISNTGNSNSLSEENLFARFSKSSTSPKGNGLGLAIVKKITAFNNWNISYTFSKKSHSFLVEF